MLLMERETIDGEELEALFDSPRPKPTLSGPQTYTPSRQAGERPRIGASLRPLDFDRNQPPDDLQIEPEHKENRGQSGPRFSLSYRVGGGEGIRTPDLYSAIVALSQLSYAPDIAR